MKIQELKAQIASLEDLVDSGLITDQSILDDTQSQLAKLKAQLSAEQPKSDTSTPTASKPKAKEKPAKKANPKKTTAKSKAYEQVESALAEKYGLKMAHITFLANNYVAKKQSSYTTEAKVVPPQLVAKKVLVKESGNSYRLSAAAAEALGMTTAKATVPKKPKASSTRNAAPTTTASPEKAAFIYNAQKKNTYLTAAKMKALPLAHFKVPFRYIQVDDPSQYDVTLFREKIAHPLKKGDYLIVAPGGYVMTVIQKEMFPKLFGKGSITESYVTKATYNKAKAAAGKSSDSAKKTSPAKSTTKSKTPTKSTPKKSSPCQLTPYTGELPQPLFRYLVEQATLYNAAAKEVGSGEADEAIPKILQVYQAKADSQQIVAKISIDRPFLLRTMSRGEVTYVNICLNRGIDLKRKVDFKYNKADWKVIAPKKLMSNVYSPGAGKTVNKCRDIAAKAFASDGGVKDKKAWDKHRSQCQNQGAIKNGESYVDWLHTQTKKNRKDGEAYYLAMQRVIDKIRSSRK